MAKVRKGSSFSGGSDSKSAGGFPLGSGIAKERRATGSRATGSQ